MLLHEWTLRVSKGQLSACSNATMSPFDCRFWPAREEKSPFVLDNLDEFIEDALLAVLSRSVGVDGAGLGGTGGLILA